MTHSTARRDIIVIGASMGGMEALKTLFAQLPPNLPAAIFVVWHMAPESPNLLPSILQHVSKLPVSTASDGELIEMGRAYTVRPDHHLVVEAASTRDLTGTIRLVCGPKENRFRPSIDVLFRSAAVAFGSRVIGVILTGALDDGAAGLYAVKECGGAAVVQDPLEAECPNMPINAMRATPVDAVVPMARMTETLLHLLSEEAPHAGEAAPERWKTKCASRAEKTSSNATKRRWKIPVATPAPNVMAF